MNNLIIKKEAQYILAVAAGSSTLAQNTYYPMDMAFFSPSGTSYCTAASLLS